MKSYTTKQGDTWDAIAKAVYDDETRTDTLMAANYPLLDTFIFDAGVSVAVPEIDTAASPVELPEWRKAQ